MVSIIFYQIDDKNDWFVREMRWDLFLLFLFYQNLFFLFFPKSFFSFLNSYHLFSTIDKNMIINKKNHKIHHLTINHLSHLIFFFSNLWELVCCFFKFHLIQFNQPLFLFKSIISNINYKLFDIIDLSSHILYHIFSI